MKRKRIAGVCITVVAVVLASAEPCRAARRWRSPPDHKWRTPKSASRHYRKRTAPMSIHAVWRGAAKCLLSAAAQSWSAPPWCAAKTAGTAASVRCSASPQIPVRHRSSVPRSAAAWARDSGTPQGCCRRSGQSRHC